MARKTDQTQRKWTNEEEASLAENLRDGLSYEEIAARQTTRTLKSIESKGRKLGGPVRAPEAPPVGGPR